VTTLQAVGVMLMVTGAVLYFAPDIVKLMIRRLG
jgi:hypothetical protein